MLFRLSLLLILFGCVYMLSCPCWQNKDQCGPPPKNCPVGLVKDACGCCDVCAKAKDEKCGGPWGTTGTCGEGLTCVKPENRQPIPYANQAEGICKPE